MKFIIMLSVILFLATEACNKPPIRTTDSDLVVDAGIDKVLYLPDNSVLLDGSASSDLQNGISTYRWKKVFGPSSFSIQDSTSVKTLVTGLTIGNYLFELIVTNTKGASVKDTCLVSVQRSSSQFAVASITPNYSLLTSTNNSTTLTAWVQLSGSSAALTNKEWKKISGLGSYTINAPSGQETLISHLTTGVYQFQFKGTDINGQSDSLRTTISVIDPSSPNQEKIITNLVWISGDMIGTNSSLTCDHIQIDLDQYLPADVPVKKVFIKVNCYSDWIEIPIGSADPININNNPYSYLIYDGHYLDVYRCAGGCNHYIADIKIIY